MSVLHTQTAFPQRFPTGSGLARIPFANLTLGCRMSEPVLGAGCQTFAQPPPSQHDTFAYSAASSATIMQSSPPSSRPSSSYSSYGTYTEHQRDSSGASLGSAGLSDPYANTVAAWGSGLKQANLEADAHLTSSPLSPLYAGSAASSDVSATGMPSPPAQMHPSPSKNAAIPPGAGVKPQQGAPGQASAGSTPRPGGNNSKTYSFMSLPRNAAKKRPRRRYDEIERLYQCSWPNCTKAYGTLNHLNAHVTIQQHGPKRNRNVSKGLQEKKEAKEASREREREAAAQAKAMRDLQYHHPHQHQPMVYADRCFNSRRRLSIVEPYPDPHARGPSRMARTFSRTIHTSTPRCKEKPQVPSSCSETRHRPALPPPHSLNSLSVSTPNPSPHSGDFHFLSLSTSPRPILSDDIGLSMGGTAGAGRQSGSPTRELTAHVSLGSSRLPSDSTSLTPLPGYEPESDQIDIRRPRGPSRGRNLKRDYSRDRAWDRDWERCYAGNWQETWREQYEYV